MSDMTDNHTLDLEAQRPDEVVFFSRYTNMKLVRQNAVEEVLVGGIRRQVNPGKRYRFEQGTLRVRVGKDVMVDHDGWLARDAEEGIERDVVDALRAHRRYNKDFWEVGKEPGRLKPYDEDVLAWMSDAVADLDVDRLTQLLEDEKNTHARPLLVRALGSALEKTRETRVKIEAAANDQKAAAAEAKPAKSKPAKAAE
jgi:hypothetical protein